MQAMEKLRQIFKGVEDSRKSNPMRHDFLEMLDVGGAVVTATDCHDIGRCRTSTGGRTSRRSRINGRTQTFNLRNRSSARPL